LANQQAVEARKVRGQAIVEHDGQIRRIDEHSYEVRSQSGNGSYQIISTEFGWACSCPDNQYRESDCKHIVAVQISLALRTKVRASIIIQPVDAQACPSCQSVRVVKHGVRHNDYGDIQQFICKDCKRTFVVNLGFEKMHATVLSNQRDTKFVSSGGTWINTPCYSYWDSYGLGGSLGSRFPTSTSAGGAVG
jgi:hypothetical protein